MRAKSGKLSCASNEPPVLIWGSFLARPNAVDGFYLDSGPSASAYRRCIRYDSGGFVDATLRYQ